MVLRRAGCGVVTVPASLKGTDVKLLIDNAVFALNTSPTPNTKDSNRQAALATLSLAHSLGRFRKACDKVRLHSPILQLADVFLEDGMQRLSGIVVCDGVVRIVGPVHRDI